MYRLQVPPSSPQGISRRCLFPSSFCIGWPADCVSSYQSNLYQVSEFLLVKMTVMTNLTLLFTYKYNKTTSLISLIVYLFGTRHCLLIALAIASSSHSPLPPHRTRHCLLIALAIASSSHSPLPPHRTRHCLLIALAIASSSHSPLPPHRTRHCLLIALAIASSSHSPLPHLR